MNLMRNHLRDLIAPQGRLSGSLKSAHAGLLMQRGLSVWDSGESKECKQNLIERVSKISASKLYELAYERWLTHSQDEKRFAFTAAKINGRLYTGLSSATALETGLTTHHTYGMPMLAGSSVKGAVAAFAERIGLPENIRQVLFGDEDNAGALIWHDAWWIPKSGKPFVGEIVTTHHQDYYNGKQAVADEMESPIPNQQIACQGSFYFVVECGEDGEAWANFANNLLFQMLQNQGMGSKTASGYGYFECDEQQMRSIKEKKEQLAAEKERQAKEAKLANLPKAEALKAKWCEKLGSGEKFQSNDNKGQKLFEELLKDLTAIFEDETVKTEEKADLIKFFSPQQLREKFAQHDWIKKKGKPEGRLKNILESISL